MWEREGRKTERNTARSAAPRKSASSGSTSARSLARPGSLDRIGFMVGDSERPANSGRRRHGLKQIPSWSFQGSCSWFRWSRTWLLVSPRRDRKSEQLSQGTRHGCVAARRSHERCQIGGGTTASQNLRSVSRFKNFAAILSTTFGKKLFTACSWRFLSLAPSKTGEQGR